MCLLDSLLRCYNSSMEMTVGTSFDNLLASVMGSWSRDDLWGLRSVLLGLLVLAIFPSAIQNIGTNLKCLTRGICLV